MEADGDGPLPVHLGECVERAERPQKKSSERRCFINEAVERKFLMHVTRAQDFFLGGQPNESLREATEAVRINPTAQLFALLAAIMEQKGDFSRAADFRLLQAFIAKDKQLWRELLDEFLSQNMFFRATTCLKRLAMMEKDLEARRMLEMQLADLFLGLQEHSRAATVLLDLWNRSEFTDMEVFSILTSIFFQQGKHSQLRKLLTMSMRPFKKKRSHSASAGGASPSLTSTPSAPPPPPLPSTAPDDFEFDDTEKCGDANDEVDDAVTDELNAKRMKQELPRVIDVDGGGDLQRSRKKKKGSVRFLIQDASEEGAGENGTTMVGSGGCAFSVLSAEIDDAKLATEDARQRYSLLINVELELLIEMGRHSEAVRIAREAAAHLGLPLLHLHPDVVVKYCIALAFAGDVNEAGALLSQLAAEVDADTFCDVLFDGADAMVKAGNYDTGIAVLQRLLDSNGASDNGAAAGESSEKASFVAALHHSIGKAYDFSGNGGLAARHFRKVLEIEPTHAATRIALAESLRNRVDERAAVELLRPLDADDPFSRITLDAQLLPLLVQRGDFEEAVRVGVALFDRVFCNDDDAMSVATGSMRRRSRFSTLPSVLSASSAIISTSTVAGSLAATSIAHGLSGVGTNLGLGMLEPSQSVATAFRAAAPRSTMALAQHGAVTATTAAGTTARTATETAHGRTGREKDGGLLYRFHRRHRRTTATSGGGDAAARREQVLSVSLLEKGAEVREMLRSSGEGERDDAGNDAAAKGLSFKTHTRSEILRDQAKFWEACSVGNTAELEALERMQDVDSEEDMPADGANGTDAGQADDHLPGLDELAQQFDDPQFRALFIAATEDPKGLMQQQGAMADGDVPKPSAAAVAAKQLADVQAAIAKQQQPTFRDCEHLLGLPKIIDLAVALINAYVALDCFQEAGSFGKAVMGFIGRIRKINRTNPVILTPIKLTLIRLSLRVGQVPHAARYAQELLEAELNFSDVPAEGGNGGSIGSTSIRGELYEALNNLANVSCAPRQSHVVLNLIKRHIADHKLDDISLLSIVAAFHYDRGSYRIALQYYLLMHHKVPDSGAISYYVGMCYLQIATHKFNKFHNACLAHALAFLMHYHDRTIAASPRQRPTVLYNLARAYHALSLLYLAVPLYQEAIEAAERALALSDPDPGTAAAAEVAASKRDAGVVCRAASANLAFAFATTANNVSLANAVLQQHCTEEAWGQSVTTNDQRVSQTTNEAKRAPDTGETELFNFDEFVEN